MTFKTKRTNGICFNQNQETEGDIIKTEKIKQQF